MAIINTLPGVSVSIDSDGVLPEHCDPDITDLPCVATRYVQAQTGQRFTVRCNVSSGGVAIVGTYAIRPLVFSDLVVTENEIAHCRLENHCEPGTIKIKVCHVRFAGAAVTRKFDTLPDGDTIISKREMKCSTLSRSVKLALKEALPQGTISSRTVNIDPEGKVAGTFIFYYRSLDALNSSLLLPRSPSPFQTMPAKRKAPPPAQQKNMRHQVKTLGCSSSSLKRKPASVKDKKKSKNDSAPAELRNTKGSRIQKESRRTTTSRSEQGPALRLGWTSTQNKKKEIKAYESKASTQSSKRRRPQAVLPDSQLIDDNELRELTAEEIPVKEKIIIVID